MAYELSAIMECHMEKAVADSTRRTYTVEEAGKMLGVSRHKAYEMAREGSLPILRAGNRLLVLKAPFERMLNGETAA
jgi:excisionase family DNA binding protein